MSARSYIKRNGSVIAVEVDSNVTIDDVQQELRRVYGAAYRLGRWSRRGQRWRAEVVLDDEKPNDYEVLGVLTDIHRAAAGWWVNP